MTCVTIITNNTMELMQQYYPLDRYEVSVIHIHEAPGKKKLSSEFLKNWFQDHMFELKRSDIVVVTDPQYFKVLSGGQKADPTIGSILEVDDLLITYCPSAKRILYDPHKIIPRISRAWEAVSRHTGAENASGDAVTAFETYPTSECEIAVWLDYFMGFGPEDVLTIDIETFSLKHYEAGIGSIAFSWSDNEGVSFIVDPTFENPNLPVRHALKRFFTTFQGKAVYHNISFDAYVLIYQLFMDHPLDQEGMLRGMDIMLGNAECSQIITYLAVNSCAGNELGLKIQSLEHSGDYGLEDIRDITLISPDTLLEYNLTDTCATWFTYQKNWRKVINDNQVEIYQNIFKPAILDIVQMQLTGMPLDMSKVYELDRYLTARLDTLTESMSKNPLVRAYVSVKLDEEVVKRNAKLVKLVKTRADVSYEFNPNSAPQVQEILFGDKYLKLPVLQRSKTKLPSTKGDVLEKLLLRVAKDSDSYKLLEDLIDYKALSKIASTFVPALLKAHAVDGWHYLHGSFKLGGCLSGRLSCSQPNLLALPARGPLGKKVKDCFRAPPGWLLVSSDFNALEDRISAVTTKDPNKEVIYSEGYDAHCWNSYHYFGDQMKGINKSVDSINSIKDEYAELRQDSKAVTFACTYGGTYRTLVTNCNMTHEKATLTVERYHELYKVSDQYVEDKLEFARTHGYLDVAFGLRLRTPTLKRGVTENANIPLYEIEAVARTVGNACGQSWCMLNSRAGSEVMGKVRSSEFRDAIKPIAQIHDAQYYCIKADNIDALYFLKDCLATAMAWQDDPAIAHDFIKFSGELFILSPSWAKEVPFNEYIADRAA